MGGEARRGAYGMGFHSLLAGGAAWGLGDAGSQAGFAGARGGATPMGARTLQTHSKRKRGLSGARSWSARRCPHEDGPGSPRDYARAGAETHAPGSNPSPSASSLAPQAPPLPGRQGACAGRAARQDAPPTPRKHALFVCSRPYLGGTPTCREALLMPERPCAPSRLSRALQQ